MNSFNHAEHDPADEILSDGLNIDTPTGFSTTQKNGFEWRGKDGLGLVFIIVSVLTLLGLTQISSGAFLTPWVQFLKRWLGWGSVLFALLSGFAGITALRQPRGTKTYPMVQILGAEGMLFSLIALLSVWGGNSVDRADAGNDGGLVGWGLARMGEFIFPGPLNALFWLALLVISTIAAFWPIRKTVINTVSEGLRKGTRGEWQPNLQDILDIPEPVTPKNVSLTEVLAAEELVKNDTPPEEPISRATFNEQHRQDRLPPINLLSHEQSQIPDPGYIHEMAEQIEITLTEFGVPSTVSGYRIGPTVTQYAVEPGFIEKTGVDGNITRQKIRVAQISALSRDLALALKAKRLRIEAPVPGQSFLGIEIPNSNNSLVRLRPLIESEPFQRMTSPLTLALGKDVSGQPIVADLAKMPHLLVAGTTGSGKSVCISSIISCLIMNNSPADLRLAILDPKKVELIRFNGLPHLLGRVETSVERMLAVLRWAVVEMDNRYKLLETQRTKDLDAFNRKMQRKGMESLPRIVVLIDEMADLMMSAPDQTEQSLVRLAQLARGVGIHLVVATQRPSTNVITGVIKANFPARIAFTVASAMDSRVILDTNGAETLLGRGDMLFLNSDSGAPLRIQGSMVTDNEIDKIVTFWKKITPPSEDSVEGICPWEDLVASADDLSSDALVEQAVEMVRGMQKASASLLQRRLRIGYPRAARLMDELEQLGVVGPQTSGGRDRDVLVSPEDAENNHNDEGL